MDCITEPLGKICEVDSTFLVPILDLEELLKVLILEWVCAEVVQEVLYRHESIEIAIECQESLSHLIVVACDLGLHFQVELGHSICHYIGLLLLILSVLSAHFYDLTILITLVLFVENVHLWEENLSKLIVRHAIRRHAIFQS